MLKVQAVGNSSGCVAGGTEGKSAVQVLLKLIQAPGGTCLLAEQVVFTSKWRQ